MVVNDGTFSRGILFVSFSLAGVNRNRQLAQAGTKHQSRQQGASYRGSWRSLVRKVSSRKRSVKPQWKKCRRQKERAVPIIPNPNLLLSEVLMLGVPIKNQTLQPPTSMQELTKNLPKNHRLWGISHRWLEPLGWLAAQSPVWRSRNSLCTGLVIERLRVRRQNFLLRS